MIGSCAKQRVVCHINYRGMDAPIVGENVGLNPQHTCPRTPGEAYAKCYAICSSLGHAEDVALRQMRLIGVSPVDVHSIQVYGHTGPCDSCRALLDSLGLLDRTTFYPNVHPAALDAQTRYNIAEAYHLHSPSSHSKHAIKRDVIDCVLAGDDAPNAKGAT